MMTKTTNAWQTANLSRCHQGQIVTPVVQWRFAGTGRYAVRYRWNDASEPFAKESEWTEIQGEYWHVIKELRKAGIIVDDHEF